MHSAVALNQFQVLGCTSLYRNNLQIELLQCNCSVLYSFECMKFKRKTETVEICALDKQENRKREEPVHEMPTYMGFGQCT